PKEASLARKQALGKQTPQETTLSLYHDNSNPLFPKQYGIVSFMDEHYQIRVFAIDKNAKLGEGAQGEVYLAQELFEDKKPTPTKPTLSIVKMTSKEMHFDDYQNEYDILNHIHRNAQQCIHELEQSKTIYLFSPFYPGINLQEICYYNFNGQLVKKPLNELILIKLFQGILSEVQQLHQNYGILHRDLKLNNFLVDINNDKVSVKLIDFGTSCLIQKSNKSFCGTIGYQAPDLTLSHNQHGIYSLQHEYYSVGVILAELIANENYHRYIE
ncbi:MAG TPA: protein kinase, partial [Candidatus Berkiella sp.]|nr:protein kinase [Candidatus Berkiella sp.]